jgi:hypothetical protein
MYCPYKKTGHLAPWFTPSTLLQSSRLGSHCETPRHPTRQALAVMDDGRLVAIPRRWELRRSMKLEAAGGSCRFQRPSSAPGKAHAAVCALRKDEAFASAGGFLAMPCVLAVASQGSV